MTDVKASRFQVGSCTRIEIIYHKPHHNAHNQQFQSQPQVIAPFILYLYQKFLSHFFLRLIVSDERLVQPSSQCIHYPDT